MVYTLRFFFSLKCSLFHNFNLFGSCIIHILYTECAKIKKIIPSPKVNALKNSLIAQPSPHATYTKASIPSFSFGSYWLKVSAFTSLDIKHNIGTKKSAKRNFITTM